ncbi:MAG TPA: EAL domain-containing protein, partial [Humisphaera sp.]
TVPAARTPAAGAALLLGALDADADATVRAVLTAAGFGFGSVGPVVVVREVRGRLAEIGTLLKDRLSPYTRSCVQAAYVPGGIATPDAAMSALMSARPLAEMVEHIEHEWVRDALSQNAVFSMFHPIVDPAAGTAFAYEALLRARGGADGKVVGAGPIIAACERLNLLHQLDQRARQAAIRGAAEHLPADARVFINFLPNTIYDPEICLRTTMEAAAVHNLSMSRLVFEVVETERIPDMAQLLHILDYYRGRGVGTAIDDMGAGHTSLDYITALRPDFVKIDREFMLAAEADPAGRRAMDAIVRASHRHGARVIAEGIETEAQAALCVGSGVDLLQGFLFAEPAVPPQPVRLPASFRRAA